MDDEAFPLKTYLLKPYPGSQSKGDNEKRVFNYMLSRSRKNGGKCIWDIKPEISNLSLSENADNIIFATCILRSYLRDQDVGLNDMGISANDQNNLKKISKQACSAHRSTFEVRDKLKQIFNSPSGFVPWQNERVQC